MEGVPLCARARACHSIVDEVWLPSTGALLCAVNAPVPQSGSARRSYGGSILTVHHLVFNCGKESFRACVRACRQCWEINPPEHSHLQWASMQIFTFAVCSRERQQDNFSWGCVIVVRSFSDTRRTRRRTSAAALIPSEKNMMSH